MKYNGTETWTPVFQAANAEEANLIRGMLETANIPALLERNTSEAFDLSAGIFGEIVVMVPKELASKAIQLLQANQWE